MVLKVSISRQFKQRKEKVVNLLHSLDIRSISETRTYPCYSLIDCELWIAPRMSHKRMTTFCIHYDIMTGELHIYDDVSGVYKRTDITLESAIILYS